MTMPMIGGGDWITVDELGLVVGGGGSDRIGSIMVNGWWRGRFCSMIWCDVIVDVVCCSLDIFLFLFLSLEMAYFAVPRTAVAAAVAATVAAVVPLAAVAAAAVGTTAVRFCSVINPMINSSGISSCPTK